MLVVKNHRVTPLLLAPHGPLTLRSPQRNRLGEIVVSARQLQRRIGIKGWRIVVAIDHPLDPFGVKIRIIGDAVTPLIDKRKLLGAFASTHLSREDGESLAAFCSNLCAEGRRTLP